MQYADKAVELLQEWGKWVVTIDTAAIGILGYTILTDSKHPGEAPIFKILTCYQKGLVFAALFGFGISLLSASWLLLALPGVLQRYQANDEDDIFCKGTMNGGGVKVVFFTNSEQTWFVFGVLAFSAYAVSFVNIVVSYLLSLLGVIFLAYWLIRTLLFQEFLVNSKPKSSPSSESC